MNTLSNVKGIIASTLGVDENIITPELAMEDIEQWDSMGNMAIISAIEENFGIEFPIEDLFELNSVHAIVSKIEMLKNDSAQ